jgi:DHA2 family multidrug resistance protein-like MFS transporter
MALVMALLPCAALGESLGYRRVYSAGVALFVGASWLCASAPSLPLLVAARFVQGLGGAAIMSLGIAILRFTVGKPQLGAAIAWNTLAVALSSAAGPTLGALVLANASWPWLFAINLPLGALVLLATRTLPIVSGTAAKIDSISALLNAAAFAALFSSAELLPKALGFAVCTLTLGALAMTALIRRELPRRAPMVPLDLLGNESFRLSVIASVCGFVGQGAALISLPFYLQHALGQNVLQTGLLMTPWPMTVALVAPLAGRLADRMSGAWLCALGGALLSFGLALTATWPVHGRPLLLIPFLVVCGAGFGLFQVSNNRNMFMFAARARTAAAGGMQSTARLTGQTIGALILTVLFTLTSVELAPRIGLGIAAALTLIAGLVSTRRAAGAQGEPVP